MDFYSPLVINYVNILFLVLLGLYLKNINFITEDNIKFLNKFTLGLLLPMFVISSFMKNPFNSTNSEVFSILIWGFIIHIFFLILAYLYYKIFFKLNHNDFIILRTFLPMSAAASFGIATATAFFGDQGAVIGNIYNLSIRIILYTYCFALISGIKFDFRNLKSIIFSNVIMISLFGFMILLFQDYTPQITINGITKSIFRIDHTLPFIYNSIKIIGSVFTPFIWILVGTSIDKNVLKLIFSSSLVKRFVIDKCFGIPLLLFLLFLGAKKLGYTFNSPISSIILLMSVAPPANILVIYANTYKRSEQLAIACLIACSVVCILLLPFYYSLFTYFFN